ncbi:hypothetical protein TNIN_152171 [Trichonephila inaurata madagascariensis]|uniref:Uncharacterized protein n=1 Tax=Trichonephila inaurata madagascariensis TaxID=2747483 RepID=A0A8X7BTT5_9ARAC|nr:hypothetical protein TNIN_152171 [Trichonephila inaurata madagascariensis]
MSTVRRLCGVCGGTEALVESTICQANGKQRGKMQFSVPDPRRRGDPVEGVDPRRLGGHAPHIDIRNSAELPRSGENKRQRYVP